MIVDVEGGVFDAGLGGGRFLGRGRKGCLMDVREALRSLRSG